MRVIVAGDYKNPVLFETNDATALLICDEEGEPNTIFRMVKDGAGWIRYTKIEDKNFDDVARQLNLI